MEKLPMNDKVVSYATSRKIKIIEAKLGPDWRTKRPGEAIDRIYNELMGDKRKNLFCKLSPESKEKLDEMVEDHEIQMADMIELMIERAYKEYQSSKTKIASSMAEQFSA